MIFCRRGRLRSSSIVLEKLFRCILLRIPCCTAGRLVLRSNPRVANVLWKRPSSTRHGLWRNPWLGIKSQYDLASKLPGADRINKDSILHVHWRVSASKGAAVRSLRHHMFATPSSGFLWFNQQMETATGLGDGIICGSRGNIK